MADRVDNDNAAVAQPQNAGLSADTLMADENFVNDIAVYFNQPELSDIVLKVGEKRFYCHKFVLAKSSDVIRTMLFDKMWATNSDELALTEDKMGEDVFEMFLQYFYSSSVLLNTSSVCQIYVLADKYNVTGLQKLCTTYMKQKLEDPTSGAHKGIIWLTFAQTFNLKDVFASCIDVVSRVASVMFTREKWTARLSITMADLVLSRNDLAIEDEFEVWTFVTKWLMHSNNVDRLAEYATVLLPRIRFGQMTPGQLVIVEESELANRPDCKDVLAPLLAAAYRFHTVCHAPLQRHNLSFVKKKRFQPRLYVKMGMGCRLSNMHVDLVNAEAFQLKFKTYTMLCPTESLEVRYSAFVKILPNRTLSALLEPCIAPVLYSGAVTSVRFGIVMFNDINLVVATHSQVMSEQDARTVELVMPKSVASVFFIAIPCVA